MTYSLQDLHDVLAEDQDDLRPPDLATVVADGRRLRRRRTTSRTLGSVAAVLLLVAGAVGVTVQLTSRTGDGGTVVASSDAVADQAARARGAQAGTAARVHELVGDVPLATRAWSSLRPDGEQGSRALPRDDREWATLQWVSYLAEPASGGRVFVSTDNAPVEPGEAGGSGRAPRYCTGVYPDCETTRVQGGVVAVERGRTDEGLRALRAAFTPDDSARSWVLVEQTGAAHYSVSQLVELAADPMMSLPDPMTNDELPDEH